MAAPALAPATLVEMLRTRSVHASGRTAFRFLNDGEGEPSSITYQGLDVQARQIAACLQGAPWARPGNRAVLLIPPGLAYIAALFGCLYAGLVAVPAYPPRKDRYAPALRAIFANSQANILLTVQSIAATVDAVRAEFAPGQALHVFAVDAVPECAADGWRDPGVTADSLAILQYTSGSSGRPKGVMLRHRNLLHNLAFICERFGLSSNISGVSWLPPYHDMGLIGGVLLPIYREFLAIHMSPLGFLLRPLQWLEQISANRAQMSAAPNFAYDLCAERVTPEQRRKLDLSSWDFAFNGAEPVRAATLERFAATFGPSGFKRSAFVPCYGLAEATLFVSGGSRARNAHSEVAPADAGEEPGSPLVACGMPASDQTVAIVDPKSGRRCRPGEVGEIWVSGPSVADGYWNQPQESAAIFGAQLADAPGRRFLRTGDLGFLRGAELVVAGRLKDLIVIRGRNYYPQDIECTAEASHPALRGNCSASFVVEDDGQARVVTAHELSSRHRGVDPGTVVKAIRQAVAEEHDLHLHEVVLLEPGALPKTSSGKVRRPACREAFLAGTLSRWRSGEGDSRDGGRSAPVP